MIEPPAFLMALGKLQAFFSPYTFNLFMISCPALHTQQSRESDRRNYVTYKRGYVKALEAEGFSDTAQKIEALKDKPFVAAQAGRLLEGTVSQKIELTHGAHAIIATQRAFYLVPWENVHAQIWGKRIRGNVLSGGGIDLDAGRARGTGR